MATRAELLEGLSYIEKQSYKDIIDICLKEYGGKKVVLNMISNGMVRRLNRAEALADAYLEKYKNADVTTSYTVFKGITETISGEEEELDKTNGLINMIVYGDTKIQRELNRTISELSKRNAILSSTILEELDSAEEQLTTLQGEIPE